MAATITGTFVLIDRASGPMRNMERQAKKTMDAIRATGDENDRLADEKVVKSLDNETSAMKRVETQSSRTKTRLRDIDNENKRVSRSTDTLGSKWRKLGQSLATFGQIVKLIKLPALASGISALASGVGVLAGGIFALLPALGQASRLLGALPATLGSLVQGMGAFKLATSGVGRALTDVFSTSHTAMQRTNQDLQALSPAARKFITSIRGWRGEFLKARQAASTSFFGPLQAQIGNLHKLFSTLLAGTSSTAGTLGKGIAGVVGSLSTGNRLSDITKLMDEQRNILRRVIQGFGAFAKGLLDLAVAARPFTNWLTKTILSWIRLWSATQRANRVSGETAQRFERTRAVLERFFKIVENVWKTLVLLGRDAQPLGDRLWAGASKATKGWVAFLESAKGATQVRGWFNALYEPLHSLGQLTKDLAIAWAHITVSPSFNASIAALDKAVPSLEKFFVSVGTLGPDLVALLTQVAELFANLPFSPLQVLLRTMTTFLEITNKLIQTVPGLGTALSSALLLGGVLKLVKMFTALGTAIRATAVEMGILQAVSTGGVASSAVAGAGASAAGGGVLGGLRGLFSRGARGPAGMGTAAATEASIGAEFGSAAGASGAAAGASRFAGLAGFGSKALGVAGKFALPLSLAAMGLGFFSTSGGIGRKTRGAISSVLPIPGIGPGMDPAQVQAAAAGDLANVPNRIPALTRRRNQVLAEAMGEFGPQTSLPARSGQMTGRGLNRAGVKSLLSQDSNFPTDQAQKLAVEFQRLTAEVNANRHAQRSQRVTQVAQRGSRAFDVRTHGGQSATAAFSAVFGDEARRAGRSGDVAAAQQLLTAAKGVARGSPKLMDEYDKLKKKIKQSFDDTGNNISLVNDKIVAGTKQKWGQLTQAMADPVEQAREKVTAGFTKIQQQAIGALTAMGYSASQAKRIIGSMDASGGKGGAGVGPGAHPGSRSGKVQAHGHGMASGGRIPGHGLQDNVMVAPGVMAAPNELIVNRHTEKRLNRILGPLAGTNLEREIMAETQPHSQAMAKGGKVGKLGGAPAAIGGGVPGHPELHQGIAAVTEAVLKQFPGLSITSTTGGSHAPGSYHYLGEAADIAGSSGVMLQASDWIKRSGVASQLTEGIHNPNLSISDGHSVPNSFYASVWAGHANHIHLAVAHAVNQALGGAPIAGGGVMPGMKAPKIKAPTTGVGGVPGAVGNAALTGVTAGVNQLLGKKAGKKGAGGMGALPASGGGSPAQNMALAQQMLGSFGWGPDQWAPLHSLWMQESGFRTTIANPSSGAYGIPQSLPGSKMASAGADWRTNPATQIKWGLGYIKDRYGSPGGAWAHEQSANWYEMGGRVPSFGGWYGNGGSLVAHSPTLIGVGESGSEHVQVTKGTSGGGGRGITVHIGHIDYRQKGDVQKAIKQEIEQVSRDLSLIGMEDNGDG